MDLADNTEKSGFLKDFSVTPRQAAAVSVNRVVRVLKSI